MQQSQFLRNLCLILAFSSFIVLIQSDCNVCQPRNNMACVNETHFKACPQNIISNDAIMYCGDGKICTDLAVGCIDEGVYEPSCPSEKSPGKCKACDGSSMFVCTSRDTFAMCHGQTRDKSVVRCPKNTVCDIKSGKFCVDLCEVEANGRIECDRDASA